MKQDVHNYVAVPGSTRDLPSGAASSPGRQRHRLPMHEPGAGVCRWKLQRAFLWLILCCLTLKRSRSAVTRLQDDRSAGLNLSLWAAVGFGRLIASDGLPFSRPQGWAIQRGSPLNDGKSWSTNRTRFPSFATTSTTLPELLLRERPGPEQCRVVTSEHGDARSCRCGRSGSNLRKQKAGCDGPRRWSHLCPEHLQPFALSSQQRRCPRMVLVVAEVFCA